MNTNQPEAVASNAELGKLYADRDHAAQGEHYMRHIDAMTREGLYSKSDIAGELAHRDMEIERLRAALVKIDAIRNDIIGRQRIGWSSHVYPLVEALGEAGFEGMEYENAKAQVAKSQEPNPSYATPVA